MESHGLFEYQRHCVGVSATRGVEPKVTTRMTRGWAAALVAAGLGAVFVGITLLGLYGPRTSEFVRCVAPTGLTGDLHSSQGMRNIAQMLVGSAENSSLYWEEHAGYLKYNVEGNEKWNRGYTGGIIGFTSRTSSMLELVKRYDALQPRNRLSPFLPALDAVNGTSSIEGLGPDFEEAWSASANDPLFLQAQVGLATDWYLNPALKQASADGVGAFGQFAYYDAMIQHGASGFEAILEDTHQTNVLPPSDGGDETTWLQAWLYARESYMTQEVSEITATRVTTAQQGLLDAGNLELRTPLAWEVYGDQFRIQVAPFCRLW